MIAVADLQAAFSRLKDTMEAAADTLNSADGALGDGDLGITMRNGSRALVDISADLPDDFGLALMACAQIFTKASSSSFGTLIATGLMAIAKETKGRTGIETSDLSGLLIAARDKMMMRGKAELGGKTVLDTLDAIAKALEGAEDPVAAADASIAAAKDAQLRFIDKPATVGRARIFAEKSVGLDDPGMLAMTKIVEALAVR